MRAVVALIVASVALVSLAGCDTLHHEYVDRQREGGVAPAAAERMLLSIDGIAEAAYSTHDTYSPGEGGMFSSEGMTVLLAVTVDAEHSVADPAQFLEFLAATAWSVNDRYPDGQVVIALSGGIDRNFDWATTASEVFATAIDRTDYVSNDEDVDIPANAIAITVGTSMYGDRFGRWPSEEVAAPDGLILAEPPTIIPVAAIDDVVLEPFAMSTTELCYRVDFARGRGGLANYEGVVSAAIVLADGTILDSGELGVDDEPVDWCFGATRPDGAYATISTEPAAGFTEVNETLTAD